MAFIEFRKLLREICNLVEVVYAIIQHCRNIELVGIEFLDRFQHLLRDEVVLGLLLFLLELYVHLLEEPGEFRVRRLPAIQPPPLGG